MQAHSQVQSPNPRIAIIMPSWIGDACMATPTLRSVRDAFPNARITGIMSPVIRDLIEGAWAGEAAWIDDFLIFQKRQPDLNAVSRVGLIGALRRRSLDLVLLLPNSWWSAAVTRAAGIRTIIGYDRDGRRPLLTDRIPVPRNGRKLRPISAVDYYLEIARWIGCEVTSKRMQLSLGEHERDRGEQIWSDLKLDMDRPSVVINSNSAVSSSRVWPQSKVLELSVRLARECDYQVVLHCGPKERDVANRIAALADDPRIVSMGRISELPIAASKAVLAKADVVVSTDSGPRHIAIALQRPVVTLFGPTQEAWTQTYNHPEVLISNSLDCRPCYQATCPLNHHRCMNEIGVQRVLDAVQTQMMVPNRRIPMKPIAA